MLSQPGEQIGTLRQRGLGCGHLQVSGRTRGCPEGWRQTALTTAEGGTASLAPGQEAGWAAVSTKCGQECPSIGWGGHAWCHRADDLITGGLCRWALASLPGSSTRPSRRLHAPTLHQLLATCSQAWANARRAGGSLPQGLGTAQGWPWGAAGADPSQAGLGGCLPSLARASPRRRASWEWLWAGILAEEAPGLGAGGFVRGRPPSLPGPPPGRSCQSLRKRDKGPGGPGRAGTQAGDGVLMTRL